MEQKDVQQTVKDILTQYLVQNQMRCTPERYAVLRCIYEQKGPFSAQQIYDLLDQTYHVTRATIYNSLDLFLTLGLVIRHPGHPMALYEKCYGVRDHFVQICTHCGRATDFRSQVVTNSLTTTHYSRFRPEHIAVCVYGICSKCQARLTRQQKKYLKSKASTQTSIPKH